jgi:hypothetical protein
MHGQLSEGLPELVVSRNRVLRSDTEQTVLLRGINRSGLEYTEPSETGFLSAAGLTGEEIREIVLGWRSNVIRLPFNQDWALRGRSGHSAEEYMAAIDQVIAWAAALGAYTILDLQWLDADTVYGHTRDENQLKRDNHVAPTPDADTILLWRTLANRYRDEPAVLFDLFNEPHDPLEDDFLPIHLIDQSGAVVESDGSFVGPEEWIPWATRLVSEIRAIRPGGLILVGGVDWAFDLSAIRIDAPNLLYSTHIYGGRPPAAWSKAIGRASELPVFVGEWGGTADQLDYGRYLARVLRQEALGWTAWSWVDYPHLVESPGPPDFRPTSFGHLVRAELST